MPSGKDFVCVFTGLGAMTIVATIFLWEVIKFIGKFIFSHLSITFM